jgi:ubiquinone/menaquinone biosynthesis C-methylase UbiE
MRRIMNKDQERVCPVERAGSLDNVLRRLLQNPLKILSPYIKEGMTALDVGCGPGFFTIPMAQLVGCTGRVIAVDLQEGMLDKIRCKVRGTEIEKRIVLHKCDKNSIGICERVDFVLLFYMVHELPDKDSFFPEIARIMRQTGRVLIVEPPFHVSRSAFDISLGKAKTAGLTQSQGPKIFLSKTAILQKCQQQNAADGRGASFSHSPHSQATRR